MAFYYVEFATFQEQYISRNTLQYKEQIQYMDGEKNSWILCTRIDNGINF